MKSEFNTIEKLKVSLRIIHFRYSILYYSMEVSTNKIIINFIEIIFFIAFCNSDNLILGIFWIKYLALSSKFVEF